MIAYADTITNSNITIEQDIYSTTTSACSGVFMNYKSGSLASVTNYKFRDYGTESWSNWSNSKTDATTSYLEDNCKVTTSKYAYNNWKFDDTSGWYYRWECGTPHVVSKSPQEKLREILQRRQAPLVIVSRKTMDHTSDFREMRARETLKRVLGDDKFKSFLKRGFISVRAKSGLIYQIFPGYGMTTVYRNGEMIERLCVVLRGNFPDTDSIIMRYLLILNDEKDFRSHAITHTIIQKTATPVVSDHKPLTEIWKGLKVA